MEYDGYGTVQRTTTGLTIQPRYVPTDSTSAVLVTSTRTTTGDVTVKTRMRTPEQRPSGNPWETAWLWWNYSRVAMTGSSQGIPDPDGYARFAYYLTLKPNGWEIGKIDQQRFTTTGGQRYLATGSTPTFPIGGTWHDVEVRQVGGKITVLVDGAALETVTDNGGTVPGEQVYTSGGVGLYCEDSLAEFSGVTVTTTAGTTTLL